MEKFKKSNLIVSQGQEVMQLDTLDELIEKILGEEYKKLEPKEKLKQRYEMALIQSILNNIPIVYTEKGIIRKDKTFDKQTKYALEKSLVIDDEKTFLLSLCTVDNLRILEKEGANIFLSDKEEENVQDSNYIFINRKVKELMEEHLRKNKECQEQEI